MEAIPIFVVEFLWITKVDRVTSEVEVLAKCRMCFYVSGDAEVVLRNEPGGLKNQVEFLLVVE